MIPRKSEIITPLTDLCGKKSFSWNDTCQKSFEAIKKELVNITTVTFPDYSLPFEIYTDASDIQIGAAITQNGKPICFFSKKLTPVQQKYPITERELLAIATTLKAYKSMLLGQRLTIYTDHKNLTQKNKMTLLTVDFSIITFQYPKKCHQNNLCKSEKRMQKASGDFDH